MDNHGYFPHSLHQNNENKPFNAPPPSPKQSNTSQLSSHHKPYLLTSSQTILQGNPPQKSISYNTLYNNPIISARPNVVNFDRNRTKPFFGSRSNLGSYLNGNDGITEINITSDPSFRPATPIEAISPIKSGQTRPPSIKTHPNKLNSAHTFEISTSIKTDPIFLNSQPVSKRKELDPNLSSNLPPSLESHRRFNNIHIPQSRTSLHDTTLTRPPITPSLLKSKRPNENHKIIKPPPLLHLAELYAHNYDNDPFSLDYCTLILNNSSTPPIFISSSTTASLINNHHTSQSNSNNTTWTIPPPKTPSIIHLPNHIPLTSTISYDPINQYYLLQWDSPLSSLVTQNQPPSAITTTPPLSNTQSSLTLPVLINKHLSCEKPDTQSKNSLMASSLSLHPNTYFNSITLRTSDSFFILKPQFNRIPLAHYLLTSYKQSNSFNSQQILELFRQIHIEHRLIPSYNCILSYILRVCDYFRLRFDVFINAVESILFSIKTRVLKQLSTNHAASSPLTNEYYQNNVSPQFSALSSQSNLSKSSSIILPYNTNYIIITQRDIISAIVLSSKFYDNRYDKLTSSKFLHALQFFFNSTHNSSSSTLTLQPPPTEFPLSLIGNSPLSPPSHHRTAVHHNQQHETMQSLYSRHFLDLLPGLDLYDTALLEKLTSLEPNNLHTNNHSSTRSNNLSLPSINPISLQSVAPMSPDHIKTSSPPVSQMDQITRIEQFQQSIVPLPPLAPLLYQYGLLQHEYKLLLIASLPQHEETITTLQELTKQEKKTPSKNSPHQQVNGTFHQKKSKNASLNDSQSRNLNHLGANQKQQLPFSPADLFTQEVISFENTVHNVSFLSTSNYTAVLDSLLLIVMNYFELYHLVDWVPQSVFGNEISSSHWKYPVSIDLTPGDSYPTHYPTLPPRLAYFLYKQLNVFGIMPATVALPSSPVTKMNNLSSSRINNGRAIQNHPSSLSLHKQTITILRFLCEIIIKVLLFTRSLTFQFEFPGDIICGVIVTICVNLFPLSYQTLLESYNSNSTTPIFSTQFNTITSQFDIPLTMTTSSHITQKPNKSSMQYHSHYHTEIEKRLQQHLIYFSPDYRQEHINSDIQQKYNLFPEFKQEHHFNFPLVQANNQGMAHNKRYRLPSIQPSCNPVTSDLFHNTWNQCYTSIWNETIAPWILEQTCDHHRTFSPIPIQTPKHSSNIVIDKYINKFQSLYSDVIPSNVSSTSSLSFYTLHQRALYEDKLRLLLLETVNTQPYNSTNSFLHHELPVTELLTTPPTNNNFPPTEFSDCNNVNMTSSSTIICTRSRNSYKSELHMNKTHNNRYSTRTDFSLNHTFPPPRILQPYSNDNHYPDNIAQHSNDDNILTSTITYNQLATIIKPKSTSLPRDSFVELPVPTRKQLRSHKSIHLSNSMLESHESVNGSNIYTINPIMARDRDRDYKIDYKTHELESDNFTAPFFDLDNTDHNAVAQSQKSLQPCNNISRQPIDQMFGMKFTTQQTKPTSVNHFNIVQREHDQTQTGYFVLDDLPKFG